MATAVHHHVEHRAGSDAVLKDKAEAIPDIIEERRKDAEGRITINKYFTGKLLGKVAHLVFMECFAPLCLFSPCTTAVILTLY